MKGFWRTFEIVQIIVACPLTAHLTDESSQQRFACQLALSLMLIWSDHNEGAFDGTLSSQCLHFNCCCLFGAFCQFFVCCPLCLAFFLLLWYSMPVTYFCRCFSLLLLLYPFHHHLSTKFAPINSQSIRTAPFHSVVDRHFHQYARCNICAIHCTIPGTVRNCYVAFVHFHPLPPWTSAASTIGRQEFNHFRWRMNDADHVFCGHTPGKQKSYCRRGKKKSTTMVLEWRARKTFQTTDTICVYGKEKWVNWLFVCREGVVPHICCAPFIATATRRWRNFGWLGVHILWLVVMAPPSLPPPPFRLIWSLASFCWRHLGGDVEEEEEEEEEQCKERSQTTKWWKTKEEDVLLGGGFWWWWCWSFGCAAERVWSDGSMQEGELCVRACSLLDCLAVMLASGFCWPRDDITHNNKPKSSKKVCVRDQRRYDEWHQWHWGLAVKYGGGWTEWKKLAKNSAAENVW